jgi:putative transposase
MKKIEVFVKPYADIIAYCLMPNHFHLLLYIRHESIFIKSIKKNRTFNDSLGIILRSYARAINKQEDMTGSLFRKETKAKYITCHEESFSVIGFSHNSKIHLKGSDKQYPQICFNYIHQNPVTAGLVTRIQDWEFSSAREYVNNEENLVCKRRALEFIDVKSS